MRVMVLTMVHTTEQQRILAELWCLVDVCYKYADVFGIDLNAAMARVEGRVAEHRGDKCDQM